MPIMRFSNKEMYIFYVVLYNLLINNLGGIIWQNKHKSLSLTY